MTESAPENQNQNPPENPTPQPEPGYTRKPDELYDLVNALPDRIVEAIREVAGHTQQGQQQQQNTQEPVDQQQQQNPPKSAADRFAKWWTGSN